MVTSFLALVLDVLALAGAWGLIAIVFNLISRRWQFVTWMFVVIAGLGGALLREAYVGPQTDRSFVTMVVIVPAIVGVLAIVGATLTVIERLPAKVNKLN